MINSIGVSQKVLLIDDTEFSPSLYPGSYFKSVIFGSK